MIRQGSFQEGFPHPVDIQEIVVGCILNPQHKSEQAVSGQQMEPACDFVGTAVVCDVEIGLIQRTGFKFRVKEGENGARGSSCACVLLEVGLHKE